MKRLSFDEQFVLFLFGCGQISLRDPDAFVCQDQGQYFAELRHLAALSVYGRENLG